MLAWMGMLGYRPTGLGRRRACFRIRGDTAVFQSLAVAGIASAVIGYAVMSFMMTATRSACIRGHGHSLEHTKWVA